MRLGEKMDRKERFSEDFLTDLIVAIDRYDAISTSTGNRFRAKIDERLDLIMASPEAFAASLDNVRPVRVRSYPYIILYEVFDDHVHFIALVHGAGERKNWFEF